MKRLVADLKYQATSSGLLRIACWCGLFLYLSALWLPRIPITETFPMQSALHSATPMMLGGGDPRWVRNDFSLFPENGIANIAWVAGSSIIIKDKAKRYFLPELVSDDLRRRHSLGFNSYIYAKHGRRLLDTYVMVKDAISRKPDYMVIIINPFWAYNDKALFLKTSVFNRASTQWWSIDDWPMQFTLSSPRNHLFALLGKHIPVLASRYDYAHQLKHMGFTALYADLKKHARHDRQSEQIIRQPLQFWMLYGDGILQPGKLYEGKKLKSESWQEGALSLANTQDKSWPNELLRKTLDAVTQSNIPSLLYVAPVAPAMSDMEAVSAYKKIIFAIKTLKKEYERERMLIIENIPQEVVDTIEFRDHLHLQEPGSLPAYLSDLVYSLESKK